MIDLARWCLPLAACLTAAATGLFALAGRPGGTGRLRPARFLFYCQTALLAVAAAVLLSAILTHRFDLAYVFGHSSTELPLIYLYSTFWAGQEGTFLLWGLYSSLIGCALIARSRDWEATVLAVWGLLHLAVLGLLLVRSPFAPTDLHQFGPGDLKVLNELFAGVPPEGNGLNPLLQNPWMAIHPPILFAGFALMAVPFAFAVAGLWRGDPHGWIWRAQGWTLLGWTILGTGLILGGYWAYETLGWGGYWAWDPVENSSLVPWLFAGALFHGLLLQRAGQGAVARFNLVLALATFASVTYGSYLNRSGVLSDFSVHSFVALSDSFNRALIAFAVVPFVLFGPAWLKGRRSVTVVPLTGEAWSRKQLLHWVTLLLAGSASLVLLGNSWPLLSGLLAEPPGLRRFVPATTSLQQEFYNQTHTPLAMLLAALMAVVMHAGWDSVRREKLVAGLKIPLLAAALMALVCVLAGGAFLRARAATPDWLQATAGPLAWAWGTLLTLATFAAVSNGGVFVAEWRRGRRWQLGPHVAHTGFMILIIGIVLSSVYETSTVLPLPLHQPRTFVGYELTYTGLRPVGQNAEIQVVARSRGRSWLLTPILRPGRDGVIRNPGILKRFSHDLYLEPGEIQAGREAGEVWLEPGHPTTAGGLTFEFLRFDLGAHDLTPDNFRVGVELKVTRNGESQTVTPVFQVVGGEFRPIAAKLPGGGEVTVHDMPAKEGSSERFILLHAHGLKLPATPETAVMQTTVKPFMSLVWLGCWLTLGGGLLAAGRRAREAVRRTVAEHPLVELLASREPPVES